MSDVLSGGRVLVLDGGLSTELESRGHDISGRLWSAQLLMDAPDAVVAAHRAYLDAGADIVTTASYQASPEGFARAGVDLATGSGLIRQSVLLALRAVEESGRPALIAGSVGPYGAMLADGSEYTGDYGDVGVDELRAFHRPRLELLAEAGVDLIAAETVPSLAEVEALLAELDRLGHPAWISLTTVGSRTRRGEPAAEAFALAASVPSVIAVGVNCTSPVGIGETVAVAHEASGKPVAVYPNSGEGWDAGRRAWTPAPPSQGLLLGDVDGWVTSGAQIVGGCCRVGPEQIRAIAGVVSSTA
ncbi:homocysteine S-methyltransferase [Kineosporia sp. J2-2]|uniref:Homocysteine S-methyltransferase n=1 Tax=Kineosporia corallincola TaxID=2835133 RepID=A0ABS5TNC9_9ACTN|nr:homocysteine S-methyltransferase [Kineosporia corallincola]MBT0772609.1 homocysteine S-methyltransferase [Kineosporia corallincola]